jgi:hypothetical protein
MYISDPTRNPQFFLARWRPRFPGFCHIGWQETKIPWILTYTYKKCLKNSKTNSKKFSLPVL